MEATTVSIPGVIVFTPQPHLDRRGFFSRTFDAEVARRAGLDPAAFVQDSMSRSAKGVIRGLHVRLRCRREQARAMLRRCHLRRGG